jgi:hypothetical protein
LAKPEKGKAVAPARKTEASLKWLAAAGPALSALGRFIDKFGVSFFVFVLMLITVWALGTAKTRDDFLREILFSEVTQTHYLQWFVVALIVDAIVGVRLMKWWFSREKAEIKRLAQEKARLQELLAGRALAHTADHGTGDAT